MNGGLVGILSHPDGEEHRGRPAVVILNSGLIHRVGACRLSVKLARMLAEAGHVVLRFDHAGIGDSPPRRDALEPEAARIAEIRSAMDTVQETFDATSFVLFGLCSGARDAFRAALADPRVVGIIQVDGFAYRTALWYLQKAAQRFSEGGTSFGPLARWLRLGRPRRPPNDDPNLVVEEWPDYPPRKEVERGYGSLVEREVSIYAVFTGSWADQYNYRNQFLHMYRGVDFGRLLTLVHLPDAQHILPEPGDQQRVLRGVVDWVEETFPDSGRSGA